MSDVLQIRQECLMLRCLANPAEKIRRRWPRFGIFPPGPASSAARFVLVDALKSLTSATVLVTALVARHQGADDGGQGLPAFLRPVSEHDDVFFEYFAELLLHKFQSLPTPPQRKKAECGSASGATLHMRTASNKSELI